MAEELHIPLNDTLAECAGVDGLGALLDEPVGAARVSILFLHGAGLDMRGAFMERIADVWRGLGARVLRFDQPYMERARRTGTRRPPDRMPIVLAATRAAFAFAAENFGDTRWVLAGKSMGARAATLLVAGEIDALECTDVPDAAAVVCLGYPLHPPKKPEQLRVAHFPRVARPTFFAQGTRDPFGGSDELAVELRTFGAEHAVHAVDGGDHDFVVRKRDSSDGQDVRAKIADHAWRFVLHHVAP